MNKLVIAALAIGAMASCTKSTVQYEQPGEISLQPVTQKATKAAIDGNKYPDDGRFKVWALWTKAAESSASDIPGTLDDNYVEYINGGEFAKKEDPNSWGGVTPYYWPTTGSLFFAGYSPADAIGTFDYSWGTKTFTATDYEQSNNIAETKDLMWFDVTDQSYNNNNNSITEGEKTTPVNGVPVKFQHALSWLTFNVKRIDEAEKSNWRIKSAKLFEIETMSTFTANASSKTWGSLSDSQAITVFEADGLGLELEKTDINLARAYQENGDVIVIPQSCSFTNKDTYNAALVIEYNLKTPASSEEDPVYIPQSVTLSLEHGTNGEAWEIGKHYIYTITFGGNEILISPTVTDWTEPDENQNIEVQ